MTQVRRRLRASEGMGLVELLAAMALLAIAIAALMTAFASSIVSLAHAGREGTALMLAERQMEAFRALPFACITTSLTGTAPTPTGLTCPSFSSSDGLPNPYSASLPVASDDSPDHRAYDVATSATGSTSVTVTVTVTDNESGRQLAQISSLFSAAGSPTVTS